MLVLGIDDAGRGPLIGPMILSGVLLPKTQESKLKTLGVADSKMLSHPRRIALAKEIKKISSSKTIKTEAYEIDDSLNSGVNLNTLEAKKAAEIINSLNKVKEKITVIVDCPSVNTEAWKSTLRGFIKNSQNLIIKCEHKADANHPVVSAASILAKVEREDSISELKKKFGDFGSGYPSDPFTKEFLKSHGKELQDSGIFRKTWATWKKIFPEEDIKQSRLFKF